MIDNFLQLFISVIGGMLGGFVWTTLDDDNDDKN